MTRTLLLAALAVAVGSCDQPPSAARPPSVVASIYPIYEFARDVAGDRAAVTLLMPAGLEPHDWEPAPADVVRIRSSRVLVYNGGGVDPWADRISAEVRDAGVRVVRTTDSVALRETYGRADPHVWLDPLLARAQVETIRGALAATDPVNASAYDANARALSDRLLALHERFERGLAHCVRREIVVAHAAFAYLAARYRLIQHPIITSLAPGVEPSPAALAALTRRARQTGLTHVFVETPVAAKAADTLAREVGAATLVLDSIESRTKAHEARAQGYVTLMDANLTNLRTALDCR